MRIRSEQLQTLDDAARADLYQRLAAYLRRQLPAATGGLSDSALLERIAAAAGKAVGYGVKTDAAVSEFVCISFAAGERFDEMPEVQAYLSQPSMTPDLKVRMLARQVVAFLDDYQSGQNAPAGEGGG